MSGNDDRRGGDMRDLQVRVGDEVSFSRTISESYVYLFAGIVGDPARLHTEEVFMRKSAFQRRIVQGVLVVGLMSTPGSLILAKREPPDPSEIAVTLGFDRIGFLKPIFIRVSV